ncbi:Protein-L-isoaspartate O-methyltransferase [Caenorhabditis elegans]|uniref:Protein-L-isoaspartate O-methyltransferase n=1 Tax=Caenorhabditis elegans TaxID=6239 RepID=PIMT_CAEEL|nr:Protein-L-isoaspartate O-methyltransferase [Caenorhabditis elegans]Q27873.1 RecName: Full=Protein-L-isoaspartate O-methyltransferase; Short=PIMT; AltName: Full=L-isoaspartyl protein carboxyl methyltransferase; AltName: Full=Protein L-isoaspartyl methyltransferase; AltName: Full=Protein-beta-aspartate methyltransferase [Caenorhabditis elegans]AAA82166.1 protein-L-isoaspartate (D-aspartate) O-methyltransferase [Caenorhabditis elegans]AAB60240.1 protein-L-isoaspartate (D-aspartate) O-methyltrans|eukprot:NP_504551.3 Protein-L-isoaspartate O-methyltransferase [Caenorhabditis elegans]
MAWRSSGSTNSELIDNLRNNRVFASQRAYDAMKSVDRGDFAPRAPYEDAPQRIGYNATVSAPHMHAAALDYLQNHLVAGAKALDVGSGSGYLTVCMAMMVGRNGTVVGIEHMPQLVELSEKNIRKHHSEQLERGNVIIIEGDGRQGFAEKAPYNAIHVGAASKGVPKALTDQLAEGGRMMIPVEQVDGNQVFMQIDKINGKIEQKIVEHVIYVPLTSREEQWNRN